MRNWGQGMSDVVVMFSSASSGAEAEQIARLLVDRRLAACVHITPIGSVYRWEGSIRREPEFQLQIKTIAEQVEAVTAAILSVSTYATPEVIATPITGGSPAYIAWVQAETERAPVKRPMPQSPYRSDRPARPLSGLSGR